MANYTAADVKKLRDATGAGMMDARRRSRRPTATSRRRSRAAHQGRGQGRQARGRALRHQRPGGRGGRRRRAGRAQLRDRLRRQERAVPAARRRHRRARRRQQGRRRRGPAGEKLSDGKTVAENIEALAAVIGEKLELGRVAVFDGQVTAYMHKRAADLPPRSACWSSSRATTSRPPAALPCRPPRCARCTSPATRSRPTTVENEQRIAEATAREEGKPEQALPKIVEGRVNGFFKEVVLLEQASVQENKKTVRRARRGRRDRQAVRPLRGRRLTAANEHQVFNPQCDGGRRRARTTHSGYRDESGLIRPFAPALPRGCCSSCRARCSAAASSASTPTW